MFDFVQRKGATCLSVTRYNLRDAPGRCCARDTPGTARSFWYNFILAHPPIFTSVLRSCGVDIAFVFAVMSSCTLVLTLK